MNVSRRSEYAVIRKPEVQKMAPPGSRSSLGIGGISGRMRGAREAHKTRELALGGRPNHVDLGLVVLRAARAAGLREGGWGVAAAGDRWKVSVVNFRNRHQQGDA